MALKITDAMKNMRELAQDDELRGAAIVSLVVVYVVMAGIFALPFWIMVLLGLSPLVWLMYGVWFVFFAIRVGMVMSYILKRETVIVVDELDQEAVDGVAKRWRF